MQDIPDEKALTAVVYFHAEFENIHSFADGNGRVGMLAMNDFIMLHGHLAGADGKDLGKADFEGEEEKREEHSKITEAACSFLQTASFHVRKVNSDLPSIFSPRCHS